jgi:flagellar hook-basal body complex protein FliE
MNVAAIVSGIPPVGAPASIPAAGGVASTAGESFGQAMQSALGRVEQLQQSAHASAERFMSGETEEIHQVALDQQRASISLDLMLQVRNKVVGAYQEIMKMQV